MTVQGTNLIVYLDGVQRISVADNSYDKVPAYTNGGISADMFTYPNGYTKSMSNVFVTSIGAPLVMASPVSRTNNAGTTATFTVTALGTNLNYQWFKGLSPVSGGNGPTLTLSNVLKADEGGYSVVVSNSVGISTSDAATLTVIDPFITSVPVGATNNAGTTASFAVTAVGTPTLTYHWFKNGGSLNNGGRISGATSTNLHISNVGGGDAGNYTVVVTGPGGTATNAPPAILAVIDPVITNNPGSLTNNATTTAMFTVGYAGTSPNFYWFKDGTPLSNGGNISGATTATLTLANVLGADDGAYTVIVSNAFGAATNAPAATLTVIDPIIVTQPQSQTNYAGASASFTVGAVGTPPVYQWLKGGVPIGGATNAVFTIGSISNADAGAYSVIVSNAFGNPASSNATLTVASPLAIQAVAVSNGVVYVTWTAINGLSYRLQSKDDVTDTNWTDLTPDFTATSSTATGTNGISVTRRFYRVRALP